MQCLCAIFFPVFHPHHFNMSLLLCLHLLNATFNFIVFNLACCVALVVLSLLSFLLRHNSLFLQLSSEGKQTQAPAYACQCFYPLLFLSITPISTPPHTPTPHTHPRTHKHTHTHFNMFACLLNYWSSTSFRVLAFFLFHGVHLGVLAVRHICSCVGLLLFFSLSLFSWFALFRRLHLMFVPVLGCFAFHASFFFLSTHINQNKKSKDTTNKQ